MLYRATVDTYVDRVLHRAGAVFATTQTPSSTWQIVESEEAGKPALDLPPEPVEQGMTYIEIKAKLTELGIPHKQNDPKRKLLQLLPEPQTYKEAADRELALRGDIDA